MKIPKLKIPKRLTSRKFWLAVTAFVTCALNDQWTEAVAVIMTYITLEGAADTAERITGNGPVSTGPVTYQETWQQDDVDTSKVEPGNTPMFDEDIKKD